MRNNFLYGILALGKDISLFLLSLALNKTFIGFVFGVIIAVIISGLVITKNPKHIPLILRYSSAECFEKIAKRNKSGIYQMAFTNFIKIYTRVRTLFFMAFIAFCVTIATVLLTFKP
ncbi:MAG TPA: hypothetical protein VJB41_02155 [Patescibacteria group bacterium]|nr:hypothetical protein [Patescibacteria group bacterium]